jgi:hypothetical protein
MPRKSTQSATKPAEGQWRQRAQLIEEYAALDQEISNFKPRVLRHQKLRELILGWYPGAGAEEEIVAPGVNFDIVISARDKQRAVSAQGKQKLFRLWGPRDFIAKAAIYLKSLPDPDDRDGLYTVQAFTGPRHLRVVAKPRAAAERAA